MNGMIQEIDFRLDRLLFNLNVLAELAEEQTSPKDFQRIVRSSLYMMMGNFSASKGAIFQFDNEKKIARSIASKGFEGKNDLNVKLQQKTIDILTGCKTPIDLYNKKTLLLSAEEKADMERIKAKVLMPLVVKDEFLGFITIGGKFSGEDYTKDDFNLISVMAHHLAVSIHSHSLLKKLMHKYDENKQLYENLSRIYYDTIHAFATAIDAKDGYTKGHSYRVSTYCTVIAKELGLSHEETEGIRIAGLLHDIGKIAIDKSIINKDNPLTPSEFLELNSHPVIGYEILSKVKFPWNGVAKMARNHHERVDGGGYPDGLKSNEIALGAKIMSLADSFDAMTTDRPYRPALTVPEVFKELQRNCDRQFDREVIESFFSILQKETREENKPVILPLLRDNFARELKMEILNGSLRRFHPGREIARKIV